MGQTNDQVDVTEDKGYGQVDITKALRLRINHNLPYRDIAERLGVSKSGIHKALKPFMEILENPGAVAAYRNNKAGVLDAVQMRMVEKMVDCEKVKKASVNNLAYAAGQLDNMIRLERDQSTANVATLGAYMKLDEQAGGLHAKLRQIEGELGIIPDGDVVDVEGEEV